MREATDRQNEYYATLYKLCRDFGRPVTSEELAEAEGVTRRAAARILEVLVYKGLVLQCRNGRKKCYQPREAQSLGL